MATNNNNNATANNVNNANNDLATRVNMEVENAINNALENLANKAKRAEMKAENVKAGTVTKAIVTERKSLKNTLQAVQNIANGKTVAIPEVINTTDIREFLRNSYEREEAIKANAKITACQKILKGLKIDLTTQISCKVVRECAKIIYTLSPVIVENGGGREIATLKKLQFSDKGVFKTDYFYIAPQEWEKVLTEIFITNGGKAPEQQVIATSYTTLPTATKAGNGPIYSEVKGKYLPATEETANGILKRYETLKGITNRISEKYGEIKESEFIKEISDYTKKKI